MDFKPDAVRLLVDRLKKNKKVGAACGRIHPIGSGNVVTLIFVLNILSVYQEEVHLISTDVYKSLALFIRNLSLLSDDIVRQRCSSKPSD